MAFVSVRFHLRKFVNEISNATLNVGAVIFSLVRLGWGAFIAVQPHITYGRKHKFKLIFIEFQWNAVWSARQDQCVIFLELCAQLASVFVESLVRRIVVQPEDKLSVYDRKHSTYWFGIYK